MRYWPTKVGYFPQKPKPVLATIFAQVGTKKGTASSEALQCHFSSAFCLIFYAYFKSSLNDWPPTFTMQIEPAKAEAFTVTLPVAVAW